MIHLSSRAAEEALVARCGEAIDGKEHCQTNLFVLLNCPRCKEIYGHAIGQTGVVPVQE